MRKFITFMVACLMATAMFAQESNRDANGKIQFGPYETNSFFSNWFVEVGGGVNVPVDAVSNIFRKDAKAEADFGGLALYGNVGKWFDPCFGARIGWQGLTSGRLSFPNEAGEFIPNHVENFVWWPNDDNLAFHYIHGDFMVNASNLFAGYKERRAIDIVPYVTTGVVFNKNASSFALGGGVQFPIRVSNTVSIVPQVQALGLNDKIFGGQNIVLQTTATVGVRINLGKKNWTRVATTGGEWAARVAEAVAAKELADKALKSQKANLDKANEDIARLTNENAKLAAENERLKNVEPAKVNFDTATFYFEIGKAVLSPEQLAQLDYFAENVIKNSGKVKFCIAGATDTATGTAKRNAELRKARAEYVCDYLANKLGGISIEESEDVLEDIGETPELSRAVVISNK